MADASGREFWNGTSDKLPPVRAYEGPVFEHFDEHEEVVRRHARLARPGGLVVVIVPNLTHLHRVVCGLLHPAFLAVHRPALMRERELRRTLAGAGLDVLHCAYDKTFRPVYPLPSPLDLCSRAVQKLLRLLGVDRLGNRFASPYLISVARRPLTASGSPSRGATDASPPTPGRPASRGAVLLGDSAALLAADLAAKLLPVATFPWVVRALGPETYGKLGFATAVAALFGLLAAPAFATYGSREVARDPGAVSRLVPLVVGGRIAFGVFAYALLVAFTLTLGPADHPTRLLLLLAGLGPLVASLDLRWVLAGRSQMRAVARAALAGQVLQAVLLLAFVRDAGDAWIPPLAVAASLAAAGAVAFLRVRREHALPAPSLSPGRWGGLMPVCGVLGLASVMSLVYDQIDTVMLKYMRGDAEAGIYVAGYRIMAMALSFLPVLGLVFFPLVSGAARSDVALERRYLDWQAGATMGLALPIAAGGALLAGPLVAFVLGPSYAAAEPLLRLLMLNLLAGSVASFLGGRLVPHGREGRYLASVALGAASNVALNAIFIPRYGAPAAALTTVASQIAVAAAAFYLGRDLPRPRLGPALAVSLPATAAMSGTVWAAMNVWNPHVSLLVALGASSYAAACAALLLVRHGIGLRRRGAASGDGGAPDSAAVASRTAQGVTDVARA